MKFFGDKSISHRALILSSLCNGTSIIKNISKAVDVNSTMDWTPSVIAVALIAFSAYNEKGLSDYKKSKNFGERSVKAYLCFILGGAAGSTA